MSIRRNIDIDRLVQDALEIPDERTKRIILYRYCLGVPQKRTLADLGQEYGLTRERILLAGKHDEEDLHHKLHFLARVMGEPNVSEANEEWHPFWYNEDETEERAKAIVGHLLKTKDRDFDKFLKTANSKFNLPDTLVINYVSISKRFMVGPYGDLGADHWPAVNPKTVRDKAYLVLVKEHRPLHFREIAELVNKMSNKERAPATVHNELIKDPRFQLVGRGTYALNG
ncbi:MAG: hypothetical protein HYW38_01765 [Candidatus Colwellbacteria bacterium]|nr:hypothetical protein [Candidatus Colwellbacteria bacterium]